jgi:hypothetical protein
MITMSKSLIEIQLELRESINKDDLRLCIEGIDGEYSILKREIHITPKWYLKSERAKRGVAEPVDLGLSVLWANANIGASSEEQPGYFVGWGDASAEKISTNYNDYPSPNPPDCISESEFDIARIMWAESWRIPTEDEFLELMQHCQWTWDERNGKPGFLITSNNGNRIFLPAGGNCIGENDICGDNECGCYWSGNLSLEDTHCAKSLEFHQTWEDIVPRARYMGMLVRPVLTKEEGGY